MYIINKIIKNQDNRQYCMTIINFSIDFYKATVSTLLLVFIPQTCNEQVCTIHQNMKWLNPTRDAGLCINFITMFFIVMLYIIELKREKTIIKYLEVNHSNPRDNNSLDKIFEGLLPITNKNRIYFLDYYYRIFAYISFVSFTVNLIISSIILYENNINYQTSVILVTNTLFMFTKMYEVYYVAFTDKNIFFSAYLKDQVQFNDVSEDLKVVVGLKKRQNISFVIRKETILKEIQNQNSKNSNLTIEYNNSNSKNEMKDDIKELYIC